jgi:ABC-type transport system involved in multi-copper enzyme maturation permease subunit
MGSGGLSRVLAVASNTFRETIRERVLYNLLFFAIVMTASGLLLGRLSIRQDEKIIKDIALAAMDLFGTAIAIFVGVGLVSKEIERRSLYPLIAKPVTRDEFLIGKFGGLSFTLFVNVTVMAAGLYLTLLLTGGRIEARLLAAVFPIFLSLVLTVSLALLFSIFTSTTLAAFGSLIVVVAGRFSDVIRNMREVAPGTPSWLIQGLYYALPNYHNFDFKDRVVYGDPVTAGELALVTAYAAAYTAVVIGAALWAFRRREFV